MHTKCQRTVEDMRREAARELTARLGRPVGQAELTRLRWEQVYPSSKGPFKRPGVVLNAFWTFDMDAFMLPDENVFQDNTAAVFAGGKFLSVSRLKLDITLEDL